MESKTLIYHDSAYIKGRKLELYVADIYDQLGSINVKTNLRIAGQQVDVYAEVPSADGFITRVGIDCKHYKGNVGVNEVNKSAQKLALIRQSGEIDIPVLVSSSGFTPEASTAAAALGVKTITLAQLLNKLADFTYYLKEAIRKYENTPFHIKDYYRCLHCTSESGESLGLIDDFLLKWFNSGGSFVTLLGDYGTGKTTFAERFFWELSKRYLRDPLSNRIPVLIPLKRYRKEINIRSLITDLLLHDYKVKIRDFGVFKSLNEQGRLIIILDAFDEMATGAEESEIIMNFREIMSLIHDNSRILLTCRTHYFKDQDQIYKVHAGTSLYQEFDKSRKNYILAYLSSFTHDDVVQLVTKYSGKNSKDYLEAIENTYNLKELARHPILLDMILTTVPEVLSSSKLVTPADLYTTYTRFWLDRDDWRTKMTHEQREFFMKELAFYFQANGITEMHFKNLPKYIRQKFPGLKTFRELDYFEADVRTCTFLVRDPIGNYSFVHRSFCEYFTALCAVDYIIKGEWPAKLWRGKSHSPSSWISPETARFSIDLLEKKDSFPVLFSNIQNPHLEGVYLLNLLSVMKYSNNSLYEMLFDRVYWMSRRGDLDGIAFRGEITWLARGNHTPRWATVNTRYNLYFSEYKSSKK